MKNSILALAVIAVVSSVASAQSVRVDIKTPEGKTISHTINIKESEPWDTTTDYRFEPTRGDCSSYDLGAVKKSERVGRSVAIQGNMFGLDQALVRLQYRNVQLVGIVPTQVSPSCELNQSSTHEFSFGSSVLLIRGKSQSVGSFSGEDMVSLTLQ